MTETWSYVASNQVSISGDVTNKYFVGQLVRIVQTTDKFFIISAISYSSPNTTITLESAGLYTVANATITAHFVSDYAAPVDPAPPFGFGFKACLNALMSWECNSDMETGPASQTNTTYAIQYVSGRFGKNSGKGSVGIYFEAELYVSGSGGDTVYAELCDYSSSPYSGSEIYAALSQWEHKVVRSADISSVLPDAITPMCILAKSVGGAAYQILRPRIVARYGAP